MDRSSQRNFNFVNLSHPDDIKDEQTQLRIRRLAMSEAGRARRKPKTRRARNEFILDFRERLEQPPSIVRFGGGELDPFTQYPVDLDDSSRQLVAYIFRHNGQHTRLLRGSWWPVGLSNATAFLNCLANAQLFLWKQLDGNHRFQDEGPSLLYHTKSLKIAGEQMKNAEKRTSNETIATVCSFMCHHYVLGVFTGWKTHRDALAKIVQLRGGVDSITQEELRITMSWSDLCGAFSQDIPPFLPLPRRWKADSQSPPHSPRPCRSVSLAWKHELPMKMNWITIFDDVTQLIYLDRAFTDQQFEAAASSGSWMEPTVVRLLKIRPLLEASTRENIIEEVCRLGTLLFLAPLWRILGANPVWTSTISRNLLTVLSENAVEWKGLKPLLMWTVYFAALETVDPIDRSQFVFTLAVLMRGLQVATWEELMEVVKGVLWIDKAFASRQDDIRDDVLQVLAQAPIAAG